MNLHNYLHFVLFVKLICSPLLETKFLCPYFALTGPLPLYLQSSTFRPAIGFSDFRHEVPVQHMQPLEWPEESPVNARNKNNTN